MKAKKLISLLAAVTIAVALVTITTILAMTAPCACDDCDSCIFTLDIDPTSINIASSVTAAFAEHNVVEVIGSRTGVTAQLNLNIPSEKKVIWKATYSMNNVRMRLDGAGTFEVANGANITQTATDSSLHTISWHPDATVTINITGGEVRNNSRQGGAVIYDIEWPNRRVNISGGVVRSAATNAIVAVGSGSSVNITGGVVFFHRNSVTVGNETVSGDGIVIAWNPETTPKSYVNGTSARLLSNPAGSATWCVIEQGIVNTKNRTVIKIDGVSVVCECNECGCEFCFANSDGCGKCGCALCFPDDGKCEECVKCCGCDDCGFCIFTLNIDPTSTNIANSITAAFAEYNVVEVIGSREITTDTNLAINIPAGKKVIWKATYSRNAATTTAVMSLNGAGIFEVADGADIAQATTGINASTISFAGDSAVTLNITGGKIRNASTTGSGMVITSRVVNGRINISGGMVHSSGTSSAISIMGSGNIISITDGIVYSSSVTQPAINFSGVEGVANITGGVVFQHTGAVSLPGSAVSLNGVIIAWNPETTPISYPDGTSARLLSTPADSATWCKDAQGIVNAKNDIAITVDGVNVDCLDCNDCGECNVCCACDDCNLCIFTINIASTNVNIVNAVTAAFWRYNVVEIIGSRTGVASSIAPHIPEDKKVIWKAEYSGNGMQIQLTGEGVFEVANGAKIARTITTGTVSAITWLIGGGVILNVTGGEISTASTGDANTIVSGFGPTVNISGGIVRSSSETRSAINIYGANSAVNITGGVVFQRLNHASITNATVSRDGIVIGWNPEATPISYQNGTNTRLFSNPQNSATWCKNAQGIVNAKNNIAIKIEGVSVECLCEECMNPPLTGFPNMTGQLILAIVFVGMSAGLWAYVIHSKRRRLTK